MSASIELRPPFLDADVVTFARALPDKYMLVGGGKRIAVARRYLPESVAARRKAGFPVPQSGWLRNGTNTASAMRSRDNPLPATLELTVLPSLLSRHVSGEADETSRSWPRLSAAAWAEGCPGICMEG